MSTLKPGKGDKENLKIGEDSFHIMVEKFSAGSKQESQRETEYHLVAKFS